jgi:hypothetical protein
MLKAVQFTKPPLAPSTPSRRSSSFRRSNECKFLMLNCSANRSIYAVPGLVTIRWFHAVCRPSVPRSVLEESLSELVADAIWGDMHSLCIPRRQRTWWF